MMNLDDNLHLDGSDCNFGLILYENFCLENMNPVGLYPPTTTPSEV